jgi:starch synthase
MKILYAASEAAPFIKTGGLADVAGSLPKALVGKGHDARVILPLYSKIDSQWRDKMEFMLFTYVDLAWRHQYCGLFRLVHQGVTFYFVDCEYYFKRAGIYGEMDDGERYAFFSKAVLALIPLMDWTPDVINCNDWQTALIPIYMREYGGGIRTVFTIHNIEYQGRYGTYTASDVFGLNSWLYTQGIIQYDNSVNLMKGAIYQADRVNTVSPSYAQELCNPYFSHGMSPTVLDNWYKFSGILNGLDTELYDPWTDKNLVRNYNANKPEGKKDCRKSMCETLGLDASDEGPIIACISRLVGHKGFDLVAGAVEEIVATGARLVILGTGDKYFENVFADAERRHKGRVSANIMYSVPRSILIYAGSDMMLMPSRSEPCGLTQMIAMRYGTIPIVRAVGGLKDSVRPYGTEKPNGFNFYEYSVHGMLGAIDYSLRVWQNKSEWRALTKAAMQEDLTWSSSADKYLELYAAALA